MFYELLCALRETSDRHADRVSLVAYALWQMLKDQAGAIGAGSPRIQYPAKAGGAALVLWADGPRGWAVNAARGAKVLFPDTQAWVNVTPEHGGLVLTAVNSYTVRVSEEG